MDLLEAGPTPGKGVEAQGRQKEGDLLKLTEERVKDPARAGHKHGGRSSVSQWAWGQALGHSVWALSPALVLGL